MPINEVFSHPFCAKELKDAMQRTSVREIAPDSFLSRVYWAMVFYCPTL